MAQLWDKQPDAKRTDPADPLPNPDLNPVMNPILGKNLGRWAQVYFTSPPEKREQAVTDLLRELESQPHPKVKITAHAGASRPEAGTPPHQVVCRQCQRTNGFERQLCAFCGSPLHPNRHATVDVNQKSTVHDQASALSPLTGDAKGEAAIQRLRDQALSSADQPPHAAAHRLKLLIAGLIVLLAGAAFLLRSSVRRSTVDPAAASRPANRPLAPDVSRPAGAVAQPSGTGNSSLAAEGSGSVAKGTSGTEDAQDLMLAQRYLAGVDGPRDPAAAASSLWKAVGKENTRATLLLADLYLRGDGVAKNCDQARLLLRAAADKGNAEAAQKLLSLESSGCQ